MAWFESFLSLTTALSGVEWAWDALWFWLLAAAFVAEVIGTMAGFGAATLLTPVACLFMDIKTAIALVAIFHLFGNGSRLFFFGRRIDWRVWALFGVTGIALSFAGATAASNLSSNAIKLALGVFLVVYVLYSWTGDQRWQLPRKPATLLTGGAASGFIAGLIGTGGAIRSACLLAFQLPKEIYIGTSAAIALVVDATRVPVYLREGFVPQSMAGLVAAFLPVAFTGSWVGRYLVRRVSAEGFRYFVLAVLALMGVKFIVDGFWR